MFNCHLTETKSHLPSPVPGNRRMTRKEKKDLDFQVRYLQDSFETVWCVNALR